VLVSLQSIESSDNDPGGPRCDAFGTFSSQWRFPALLPKFIAAIVVEGQAIGVAIVNMILFAVFAALIACGSDAKRAGRPALRTVEAANRGDRVLVV
jgi:hypothetical protein